MGGLGYFATYTLGNLNAAQLYAKAMEDPSVSGAIHNADYSPLLIWLRHKIHKMGSTLHPGDLMLSATGKAIEPTAYLNHLRRRFIAGN
jgi:carboxypeptidase Taq